MVCVVDDDRSVRLALERLLRSCGIAAAVFASAGELLQDDRRRQAACFLIDIQMPEMNGFELAARLAAEGSDAPVIFITAHLEETTLGRAEPLRPRAVLAKPFDDRELLQALPRACRGGCRPGDPSP